MTRFTPSFLLLAAGLGLSACASGQVTSQATPQVGPGTSNSAPPPENLITNPSFEQPLGGENLETSLPGWNFGFVPHEGHAPLTPEEASLITDPAQAHSGKNFIRMKPSNRPFMLRTPRRPQGFEPGLYEVSVWAKGVSGPAVGFGMDALGANLGYGFGGLNNTWQKYSRVVYSRGVKPGFPWPEQTQFTFYRHPGSGESYIDLDDASIIPLTSGLADVFDDHMVLQRDKPLPIWGWTKNSGQEVKVRFNGQTRTTKSTPDGTWRVTLDPIKAGGPYTLELDGRVAAYDVLVGDVWICSGQSNMEMGVDKLNGIWGTAPEVTSKADHPQLRLWQASKQYGDKPMTGYQKRQDGGPDFYQATWNVCTPQTVRRGIWGGFSAVGYFFGKEIQETQKVPVGLMMIANGGTQIESFMSPEALAKIPRDKWAIPEMTDKDREDLKIPAMPQVPADIEAPTEAYRLVLARVTDREAVKTGPNTKVFNYASSIYRSLMAPVYPAAVRGVLWYQGEHNSGDAAYGAKLTALIEDWRTRLGSKDLPVIISQLCDWRTANGGWEITREQQLKVSQTVPNTALVVTMDLADKEGDGYGAGEIHPKNKQDVGHRNALAARALVYKEKIVSSGPAFKDMKIEAGKATLSFNSPGSGLVAKGDKLEGFKVAGPDQKFVTAQASLVGNTVVVSSPEVTSPVAVRYCYSQTMSPKGTLYNAEGLPASPFRTDDWGK